MQFTKHKKSVERIQRESDKHKETVLEKFAKELLDSVDNLERAIQAAGDEETPVLEGIKLTLKSLLTTLEKFGVVEADTKMASMQIYIKLSVLTQMLKRMKSVAFYKRAIH